MMTQEEYVNEVLALRRQGKTISEIAEELEYHPATISKWLKAGGPPPARTIDPAVRVIDERWGARIGQLVSPPAEKLLASRSSKRRVSRGPMRAWSVICGTYAAPGSGLGRR
jgi:transposase-like protein